MRTLRGAAEKLLVLLLAGVPVPVLAHLPHDDVGALAVSSSFAQDGIGFVIVDGHYLKRTTDGGHTWKLVQRGLVNRSNFTSIALSPGVGLARTVLAGTVEDGVYRSDDGGDSWSPANGGLSSLAVALLAVSPAYATDHTAIIVTEEGSIYLSTSPSLEWHLVYHVPGGISSLAFSPAFDRDRVIVAGGRAGGLFYSRDGGTSWQPLPWAPSFPAPVSAIGFSPSVTTDGVVFLGLYGAGVQRTLDRGHTWQPVNSGLTDLYVTDLVLSPSFALDGTLFASTKDGGVFRSTDRGTSWQPHNQGLWYSDIPDIHYKDLAVSNDFANDRTVLIGAFEGLFRSTDGGARWIELEVMGTGSLTDLSVSPSFVADGALAFSTRAGGAYLSHDGGQSWQARNVGLERTTLYSIAFSPDYARDRAVFSTYWENFLALAPGEQTWTPHFIAPSAEAVSMALSPEFATDGTVFVGLTGITGANTVYRSVDRGLTWQRVMNEPVGGGAGGVPAVAVSPGYGTDGVVFAATYYDGLFRSDDRGLTWQRVFLEGAAIAPGSAGHRQCPQGPRGALSGWVLTGVALSPAFPSDGTAFLGTSQGLYRSTDGGMSWDRLLTGSPLDDGYILQEATSPAYASDRTILASVKGTGLFKSVDAGTTWAAVGADLIGQNRLLANVVFSPGFALDRTIFGATFDDGELMSSTDGGESWRVVDHLVRYEDYYYPGSGPSGSSLYDDSWKAVKNVSFASGGGLSVSSTAGSTMSFNFTRTSVTIIGPRAPSGGTAEVRLDGALYGLFSQYDESFVPSAELLHVTSAGPGPHVLTITKMRPDGLVVLDAFDVR